MLFFLGEFFLNNFLNAEQNKPPHFLSRVFEMTFLSHRLMCVKILIQVSGLQPCLIFITLGYIRVNLMYINITFYS